MRVIVTDLDGTLLDHHTYSAEAAGPALAAAREAGVPVVPCSSKTLAEMYVLARRLALAPAPLIVENGSAIWFPATWPGIPAAAAEGPHGGRVLVLGATAEVLRPKLDVIARDAGLDLHGFSRMSVAEVAERTGLSLEMAALARQRQFSEPFVADDRSIELSSLNEFGERIGARVTRGGRFFHLLGATDKGAAVGALVATCPAGTRTLGLGDAPNDLSLLRAVDEAAIVPQASGSLHPDLVAALPHARHAPAPGPAGWNAIVLAWLTGDTPER